MSSVAKSNPAAEPETLSQAADNADKMSMSEPSTLSAVTPTSSQVAETAAPAPGGKAEGEAHGQPMTGKTLPADGTTSVPSAGRRISPASLGKFGDYELLEEIARGGMAVVFRARETNLGRIVALKMILTGALASAEEVRRFRLEAEEASRLDHPNIVPIYHIGEHEGQHYFTMKLIEGGTLRNQERGTKADLRRIARTIAAVAHAVHYAHRHGVLHRDIKPGNILVDEAGQPHVTDFGLAKRLGGKDGQTRTGVIVGTPAYMSPEQAAARKDLTTASDIYSVGAVLYFLITGQPPFEGPSTVDTLVKVLEQEPAPPRRLNPSLDRDLETICLTCLNKDLRRRYASAEALAHDLERYLAGEPIRARRVGRLERMRKWVRRRPLAAALVAVVGLATLALAAGGWMFSVRLQAAVEKAQAAQLNAETGEKEADLKRQQVSDYLVYLNERLANLKVDQPIRLEFLHEGLALCERFRKSGEDAQTRRQLALLYRCLGELEQERTSPERAREAFGKALTLLEALHAEAPQEPIYGSDLAVVYSRQASLQEGSGAHEEALATLHKAIGVQDRLAAEPAAGLTHRQRAAEFRFSLGVFLEEQKKPTEAEAAYRAALERLEPLVADRAAPAIMHWHFSNAAGMLAWLLVEKNSAQAERLLARCLQEMREARSAQEDNPNYAAALWEAYADLAAFLQQRGQHADLAALARQLRGDFLNNLEHAYHAALFLTDAVRVVAGQQGLNPPQRDALSEEYSAAAVAMLEKALKEGFTDRARIEVDPKLDPLRQRKDFGALMTELERRFPSLTAEQELASLQALFDQARQKYQNLVAGSTQANRLRAQAVRSDLQAYSKKFLGLAQKRGGSWVGMEALVRVLETCQEDEVGPPAAETRRQAARLLAKDHLHNPEFKNVCLRFCRTEVPEVETLLNDAMSRHAERDVRGLAGLTLALNRVRAANHMLGSEADRAQQLIKQSDQDLARLIKEYGNVQVGRSSLGEIARYLLDEVRHLSVGSRARDIAGEDLLGRPLKLSQFSNRVVVLDFWADWCGFCRQMYPQEQELQRRFKDRPFVLLGINCDEDRDSVLQTLKRKGLGWQSWWDGGQAGRIQQEWHISAYPMTFVLDHKHIIRYRDVRGKELDDAVAKLVQEAEAEHGKAK